VTAAPRPQARRRLSPDRPASLPQQPVALLHGPGLRIVHGNPAFVAEFGAVAVGLPAREGLVGLPSLVFDVADRVLTLGRPLACWVEVAGTRRRLTVAPRRDPETDAVYGVAIRLATA
jgi:hypothetical protein